ncbi:Bax inhibitor-1 family protein, partial [Campylobacter coli]
MSLYDRDYSRSREFENTRSSELGIFIKQTYQLFAASLLAATVGAYVGIYALAAFFIQSQVTFWILFAVEIGLLIALQFKKREAPLNLILLFGFTFCSGLTLTPLLISVLALPAGGVIIAQAFALTTVAFAALSIFA